MLPETPIELTIERLGQLGEGVALYEGRTVFIPGAFPGERVREPALELVELGTKPVLQRGHLCRQRLPPLVVRPLTIRDRAEQFDASLFREKFREVLLRSGVNV